MRAASPVDEFLEQKLASWQKRLKLDEWKITVTLTPRAVLKPTGGLMHQSNEQGPSPPLPEGRWFCATVACFG